MIVIKVTERQIINGRIREVGEIVQVEDGFVGGILVDGKVAARNRKEIEDFVRPRTGIRRDQAK